MITIVLVGKSGSGKSSTGNSILGENFSEVLYSAPWQKGCSPVKKTAVVERDQLTVIDGLDISQIGENAKFNHSELAPKDSGEDILVFLIVIKYKDVLGVDVRNIVEGTKKLFGEDIFKNFGICILTFGDQLKRDKGSKIDISKVVKKYFQQQSDDLQKKLFQECNKRFVLFNNKSTQEKEKEVQVNKLMKVIKNLKIEKLRCYGWNNMQAKCLQDGAKQSPLPDDIRNQNSECIGRNDFESKKVESKILDTKSESEMANKKHIKKDRSNLFIYPCNSAACSEKRISDFRVSQALENKTCSTSLIGIKSNENTKSVPTECRLNAEEYIMTVTDRDLQNVPKRQKLKDGRKASYKKMPFQTQRSNEVTLLLVGSAGNGKSSTGNYILRKHDFKTSASTTSQCTETTRKCVNIKGVKVNVVDGPGVDTTKSPDEIFQTIEKALKLCDYRFSALLIVLKYGARFTKHESDVIKMIKGFFGSNVIKMYGVCIMTHGDFFEADNVDDQLSFVEWCQQQEGQIHDLFDECSFRCALFNNKTKDTSAKELQVEHLLEKLPKEKCYSENEFTAAREERQKLKIELNAPIILEETKGFIKKTKIRMSEILEFTDKDKKIMSYKEMLNDVNAFRKKLHDNYGETDIISQSYEEINVLGVAINSKLREIVC